jgi:hypothetical protein
VTIDEIDLHGASSYGRTHCICTPSKRLPDYFQAATAVDRPLAAETVFS